MGIQVLYLNISSSLHDETHEFKFLYGSVSVQFSSEMTIFIEKNTKLLTKFYLLKIIIILDNIFYF